MVADPVEVNGSRFFCSIAGGCCSRYLKACRRIVKPMSHRPKNRPGAKPGATREQIERRERFERARRESLKPSDDTAVLYGWHPVTAALQNPERRLRKILATENAARRLAEEKIETTPRPEIVRPDAIAARLPPDAVHQGLYVEADPLPSPPVEELAADGVVLVLDQITDPHNVGAIFRSAAAFAATAIVTTARHSPETTGVLAKAASGALEHVPFVTVQNLARGLAALKQRGFLVVGLDSSGGNDLAGLPLKAPLALVLGAEGKGLRQLTKDTCDHIARLDLPGAIQSLNVSNAAALALYVAHTKLKG
jgi:23S rRNA (guanosine2251-2'-O)-methyltransferase